MLRVKRPKMLFIGLAWLLAGMLMPRVAYVQEKFEGDFWNRGEHFQLNNKVVPVYEDGIHDPSNDAVKVLQEPVEAMENFPRDNSGVIDWVKTLDQGMIAPRKGLYGDEEMHAVDFDVIFKNTASMPYVRFPHLPHTKWLTCKNCHPGIFLPQRGGNFVTMAAIIEGEFCGVCHGKVAFPPLECNRCHSVARENVGLR